MNIARPSPAGRAPRWLSVRVSRLVSFGSRRPGRSVLAPLALMALLLLGGCTTQYPQSTLDPHSSDFAVAIQDLFMLIFWPAVLVFVVVEGALLYTIFRYRQRPGHGRPAQVHGNTRLEIAWTIAPAVVLAFIAVPTVRTIFITQAAAPANALQIQVTGHQWWWEFHYPEYGITTANEFAVPVGRPVNFAETSADVIHSFWVPAMGGKRDVIPNHVNYLWFTPAREGLFLGQCAEFCGDAHADMRLRMLALPPDQFEQWVAQQRQPARPVLEQDNLNADLVKQGEQLVGQKGCLGCHTIQGHPSNTNAKVGPNLTHVGSRTTIAAGKLDNTVENLARWVHNPPAIKEGVKMPANLVNETEARAVAEYLKSLK